MSFFHNKNVTNVWATIMPFGPVTLIFYWPKFQALQMVFLQAWAVVPVVNCEDCSK